MKSVVGEGFVCTAYGDIVAGITPTDIDLVRGNTVKTCERALDRLAVDVIRVHESELLYVFHGPTGTGDRSTLTSGKTAGPEVCIGKVPWDMLTRANRATGD
jgi:hypothetical protein